MSLPGYSYKHRYHHFVVSQCELQLSLSGDGELTVATSTRPYNLALRVTKVGSHTTSLLVWLIWCSWSLEMIVD